MKEEVGAGKRELLPVRQEDGRWQARHAKAAPQQKGEPRKKGKRADTQRKGSKGSESVEPAVELTFAQKRAAIAKLSASLLHSPHKNIGLLQQLQDYAKHDTSPAAQRLAALSLVAVLCDIIPSYRIRLPTDKELAMKVSAEIESLRAYEKALLNGYETTLAMLRNWLRGTTETQRLAGVKGLAALLGKAKDFNSNEALIGALAPVCNWADEEPRTLALRAFIDLFETEPAGDPALIAVRHMAALLRSSSFNVKPALLETWLHLRLDGATAGSSSTKDERWGKRKGKMRRQALDPVAKELAAAAGDRGNMQLKQASVLEQLFVSYARVVKKNPAGPLMPVTLQGIAKFAHQVNIELLLDLVANLRNILRNPSLLSPTAALHCVHALLRLLSGHGSALTVDMRDVQQRLFTLFDEPAVIHEPRTLATALDCLEHLCKQRSALLAARVASFFVRLLECAANLPHGHAIAVLVAASRLLIACPRVNIVLDGSDRAGPPLTLQHASSRDDVDSPSSLQSTAWILSLLSHHYHPSVAQIARKLAQGEPLQPRFANATPLRLMVAYSDASGAFNPPPQTPAKRKLANDSNGRAGKLANRGTSAAADSSFSSALGEAVNVAVEDADASCIDFRRLMRG